MFKKKTVIFIFLCLFSFNAHSQQPQVLKPNLPYLKIVQLDGKVFDLEQQKDKVTLILFWAHWCHNCKKDMPALEEIYQKYKDRGLSIIAISTDAKKHRDKVEAAAAKFSYPSAIASDIIKASFSPPSKIPVYYLISKDGRFLGEIFMNENFNKKTFEATLLRNL